MAGAPMDIDRLRDTCARAGLLLDAVDDELVERLRLLAERTPTLDDCDRMGRLAELTFDHFARAGRPFTDIEKATVRIGNLLSDVGKSGPPGASPGQQRLVAEMFAVERVPDGRISVAQFFETYFPEDATARRQRFESLGLSAGMSMRRFWDRHGEWTLELIRDAGVLPESVAAAATHHLLEDENPGRLVDAEGRFLQPFGTNLAFDRPEKLVIVLDKYDAARRRSELDHAAAIAWLRELVENNDRFGNDAELVELIDVLDAVVSEGGSELYSRC